MNKKTALLVIDMQNDFIRQGAVLEVNGIRKRINKLREFIDKMREKDITIVYTKHVFDPITNQMEAKLCPIIKDEGLRADTEGVEICRALKPVKGDFVFTKRRFDAFIGTGLELTLRAKGIKNVIITGTMTNICCESTARSAMMKDFNVFFCSDLNFASDKALHDNTLKNISILFGKVVSSEEVFRLF